QQVDAVERGIVRQLVELVAKLIELLGQVCADGIAADLLPGRAAADDQASRVDAIDAQFLGGLVFDAQLAVVIGGADAVPQVGIGIDQANQFVRIIIGAGNRGSSDGN